MKPNNSTLIAEHIQDSFRDTIYSDKKKGVLGLFSSSILFLTQGVKNKSEVNHIIITFQSGRKYRIEVRLEK